MWMLEKAGDCRALEKISGRVRYEKKVAIGGAKCCMLQKQASQQSDCTLAVLSLSL